MKAHARTTVSTTRKWLEACSQYRQHHHHHHHLMHLPALSNPTFQQQQQHFSYCAHLSKQKSNNTASSTTRKQFSSPPYSSTLKKTLANNAIANAASNAANAAMKMMVTIPSPSHLFEGEQRWVHFSFTEQEKDEKQEKSRKNNKKTNNDDEADDEEEAVMKVSKKNVRFDKLLSEKLNLSREYVSFLIQNQYCRLVPRSFLEQQKKRQSADEDGNGNGNEESVFDMKQHENDEQFFVDKKNMPRKLKTGDRIFVFLQQRHLSGVNTAVAGANNGEKGANDDGDGEQSMERMVEKPLVTIDENNVIYEDDHVIVVNKPQGYAVHASAGHAPHTTMLYAIRDYVARKEHQEAASKDGEEDKADEENEEVVTTEKKLKKKKKKTTLKSKSSTKKKKSQKKINVPKLPTFVNLVHRLDKETSGVLICGKNSHSVQHLNRQFMEKTVNDDESLANKQQITKKIYCAICVVPRVDKFLAVLKPMSVDSGNERNVGDKPDPILESDAFDLNEFSIEVPGEGRRSLTQADLDKFSVSYDETEPEQTPENEKEAQMDEDFEDEDDLEKAILREEQRFDEEIEDLIARAHLPEEPKNPIERNQMIIVNKPITVFHKSHRHHGQQDGGGMYAVRYSIEQENIEEGTGEELLMQKQMKKSKSAKSVIRVVEINREKQLALVMVSIKSGRTHQIRSHLTSIGAPVLGDQAYYDLLDNRIALGIDRKIRPKRMMLHCMRMRFRHPFENKAVHCFAPVQGEMLQLIQKHFTEESVRDVVSSLEQNT